MHYWICSIGVLVYALNSLIIHNKIYIYVKNKQKTTLPLLHQQTKD